MLALSSQPLKECFESQDTEKLQAVIRAMDPKDARYHMKRCVDSGLWKPSAEDPNTNPEDGFKRRELESDDDDEEEAVEDADGEKPEHIYEEVPPSNE